MKTTILATNTLALTNYEEYSTTVSVVLAPALEDEPDVDSSDDDMATISWQSYTNENVAYPPNHRYQLYNAETPIYTGEDTSYTMQLEKKEKYEFSVVVVNYCGLGEPSPTNYYKYLGNIVLLTCVIGGSSLLLIALLACYCIK
jgi:hypothetical protein